MFWISSGTAVKHQGNMHGTAGVILFSLLKKNMKFHLASVVNIAHLKQASCSIITRQAFACNGEHGDFVSLDYAPRRGATDIINTQNRRGIG